MQVDDIPELCPHWSGVVAPNHHSAFSFLSILSLLTESKTAENATFNDILAKA